MTQSEGHFREVYEFRLGFHFPTDNPARFEDNLRSYHGEH
jgi:hypothetical protein